MKNNEVQGALKLQIIPSPVLFSIKTPKSGWLNLSLIRQLETGTINNREFCRVTWHGGDKQIFHGDDALSIIYSWQDATKKYYRAHHSQCKRRVSI